MYLAFFSDIVSNFICSMPDLVFEQFLVTKLHGYVFFQLI